MLALMATALVVIVIMYLMSRGADVDRGSRIESEETVVVRDTLVDVQTVVASLLDESVAEAVLEIGAHGGFPAGMVPRPGIGGVPYFFFKGSVVNLPSIPAVEKMLARRVGGLVGDGLGTLDLGPGISVGTPKVTARLVKDQVEVDLDMPYTVTVKDASVRETASISHTYPFRLRLLLLTAQSYLNSYEQYRTMEGTLLTSIINDERVPSPPGMISSTVRCDSHTILKARDDLVGPVRENVRLAVAQSMSLINKAIPDTYLEWDHSFTDLSVDLKMVANTGVEGFESTSTIYLIPAAVPLTDAANGQCLGYYTVSYTVEFPVRLVLRDLNEASQVVGAPGKDLIRPLELVFYIRPLLVGEDVNATVDLGLPAEIDDPCSGSCTLHLEIQGSQSGTVDVDACTYAYTDGRLTKDGVPCGVHTITVGSTDPVGLSRTVVKRNVRGTLNETITVRAFGSVAGRVYINRTVLCTTPPRIEEREPELLGYVEGTPSRYVEVLFAPLGPGPLLRAIADEEGKYRVGRAEPGRYLRIVRPSYDEAGNPTHLVQMDAALVELGPGANPEEDIIVQPLLMERVGDIYVPVAAYGDGC